MRPENPEEPANSRTQELFDQIRDYVNTQVEIVKLEAIGKASVATGTLAVAATLVFLFVCVFILANIGLAILIGDAIGNGFSGFFIVAGFYLLVAVILYLMRDTLVKKVISPKLIGAMMPDEEFNRES
jgi:hypothetical protein